MINFTLKIYILTHIYLAMMIKYIFQKKIKVYGIFMTEIFKKIINTYQKISSYQKHLLNGISKQIDYINYTIYIELSLIILSFLILIFLMIIKRTLNLTFILLVYILIIILLSIVIGLKN